MVFIAPVAQTLGIGYFPAAYGFVGSISLPVLPTMMLLCQLKCEFAGGLRLRPPANLYSQGTAKCLGARNRAKTQTINVS